MKMPGFTRFLPKSRFLQKPKGGTEQSLTLARWALYVAVGSVIVAVLAFIWSVVDVVESDASDEGGSDQACSVVGDQNTCIQMLERLGRSIEDDQLYKEEVARRSTADPSGAGPWPFVVVDTEAIGLVIRDSDTRGGVQVGSAGNRARLWVDCYTVTDFDPESPGDGQARWLRIRWPNSEPTNQFFASTPELEGRAYAYARYAIPLAHNGDIPPCDSSAV